jgi:RHS repeat-associated protein
MNRFAANCRYVASVLLWFILGVGAVLPLRAQEEPVAVPMKFRVVGTVTSTANSSIRLTLEDGKMDQVTTPQSDNIYLYLPLEVGKTHTLTVSTTGTATITKLKFGTMAGFTFLVEGKVRKSLDVTNGSTIEVRVLPALDGVVAPAGTASSFSTGQVKWGVALGSDRNGNSLGWLWLVGAGTNLTAGSWSLFDDPDKLHFDDLNDDVDLEKVSSKKRQIATREGIVDIYTPTTAEGTHKFELRFYHWAAVQDGFKASISSLRTFIGAPYITYKIYRDQPGYERLRIQKLVRNPTSGTDLTAPVVRTESTTLERRGYTNADSYEWTAYPWTLEGATSPVRTVEQWSPVTGGHTAVTEAQRLVNSVYTADLKASRTYTTPDTATNSKLPRLLAVAITAPGASEQFEDKVFYHTDTALKGSFGFPRVQRGAGGTWSYMNYYEPSPSDSDRDKKHGIVTDSFQPWLDNGLTGDPATVFDPKPATRLHTTYEYSEDEFEMLTRPKLVQSFYETGTSSILLSKSEYVYSTFNSDGRPVIGVAKTDTVGSAGQTVTSGRAYFSDIDTNSIRRSQTYSETSSTGTQVSYCRRMGAISITGSETAPVVTFTDDANSDSNRVSAITGWANAVSGGTEFTHFNSVNIQNIFVVAGRSSLTHTYRNDYGQLIRTESYIWDGAAWAPLGWEHYFYNFNHQLVRVRNNKGDLREITYSGEYKVAETDFTGIQTTFEYDEIGRLKRSVLKGIAPQADVATDYTYDAAGQVLTQVVSAIGGTEQIITSRSYDAAGRPKTETAPLVSPVAYSYDPINFTKTTTRPDQSYITETTYLDGQPKSVTGTGTVAGYSTYGFASDGRRWTQVNAGTPTSPRWQKSWADGLGRTVRSERPGFSGQSNFVEENFFENFTGRPSKTTRTGIAATVTSYDAYGQAIGALDINANGLVDYAGPDRVSYSDSSLVYSASAWWQASASYSYLTANSSTATLMGSSLKRVSGFAGNLRDESQSTDAEGNVSTSQTYLDRAARTVTTQQSAPGVTGLATTVTINGLATSATAPDGLTSTNGYDALRRPITVTDPRTGTYTTIYRPGSTQVESKKDARNITVASFSYDTAGRPNVTTDAAGKATRVLYHNLGGVSYQWGDTVAPVSYDYDLYGQRISQSTYRIGSGWTGTSWPTSTTGTADTTTWSYDEPSGLLQKKTDATQRYVEYAYNVRGQPVKRYWARTTPVGNTTERVTASYFYDAVTADPTSTTYNDGTPGTAITYDRNGRPLSRTDAAGTRGYAYDATSPWRFAGETLPAYLGGRTLTPQYSETTTTNAGTWGPHTRSSVKGSQIGYALGSLANPTRDLRVLYYSSNVGRLAGLQAYGPGGGDGGTGGLHYTYTANSRLVAGLFASQVGYALQRTYEPQRDLLSTIDTTWANTSRARYEYTYDDRARRTAAIQGGDAFTADYGDELRTDYDYDDRGQLKSAKTALGETAQSTTNTTPLRGRQFAYSYDTMGNRATSTHDSLSGAAKTAGYRTNALNQYTDRDNKGVPYRGVARADATVAVDGVAADRRGRYFWQDVGFGTPAGGKMVPLAASLALQGAGGKDAVQLDYRFSFWPGALESFVYDADGNMTEDGTWFYAYDAENRLKSMERKGWTALPGAPPMQRLEFSYDFQGRRIGKKVYIQPTGTAAWQLQKELRFIYDGWNLIAELDATQTELPILRSYAWGLDLVGSLSASGGVGALVQIWDHANNTRYLPAYDGNGNLAALLNAQTGSLAAAYEYSPYGEAIRVGGTAAIDNPFRFSTKYTDHETGLIYYGYRYYDAKNGRFINRDPIEERGGLNLYGFCGNDGVNRYDYLGMSWFSKLWNKVKRFWNKYRHTIISTLLSFIPYVGPFLSAAYSAGVAYKYGGGRAAVLSLASRYPGGTISYAATAYTTYKQFEHGNFGSNLYDYASNYAASYGTSITTQYAINQGARAYQTSSPRDPRFANSSVGSYDARLRNSDGTWNTYDQTEIYASNGLGAAQGTVAGGFGPFGQEQPNSCVPCAIRNDLWLNGQPDPGEGQIRERLGSVSGRGNADFTANPTYNTGLWTPKVLDSYGITGTVQDVSDMSAERLAQMLPDGSSAIIGYKMPGANVGHAVSVRSSGGDLWIYNPGGDMRTGGMTVVTSSPGVSFVITTPAGFLSGGRTISTVITTTPGSTIPIQVRLPPARP